MALPTLACKECGHLNEGERVYCHNCGSKLDRSGIAPAVQQAQETPEQRQRRIKKMMNPDSGINSKAVFKTCIKTLFYAAMTAAIINMVRTPDNVPKEPEIAQASDLTGVIRDLLNAPASRRVVFSENDVNDFLRQAIRAPKKGQGMIQFGRVYSQIKPEGIEISLERRVLNHPIHIRTQFDISSDNQKLHPEVIGGSIGRLQIPAVALPLFEKLMGSVWQALDRDYKLLQEVWKIETKEKAIILYSKPLAARPTPPRPTTLAPTPTPQPEQQGMPQLMP